MTTTETRVTDSKGWHYRTENHEPAPELARLMDTIYATELEEELDWHDCIKLALYIDRIAPFETLTADKIAELWISCQDAYYGEYSSEAEFAESYFLDTGFVDENAISNLVIDWGATYNYALQFDFWNAYVYARNDLTNESEVQRLFWVNQ